MVLICVLPSSSFTLHIAPGILPEPCTIFPPSKAGPAAVEVTRIRSRFPIPISPLVPRSISILTFSDSASPQERISETISAPTKVEIPGRIQTFVRYICTVHNRSMHNCAVRNGSVIFSPRISPSVLSIL